MVNNGWQCDNGRQFKVLIGMQGDGLTTLHSSH